MTVPVALLLLVAYGCATTTHAPQPQPPQHEQGLASWYGQEFAGRTTANGEIFDPMVMTAAHRTLPFGTIVDVTNPKSGQTVRVRINDRGPYINNRIIDLSFAAAQQIGLTDDGTGEVTLNVVKLGKGDREPPAPFTVNIPDNAPATTAANEPPKIEFPLPSGAPAAQPAPVPQPPAPAPPTPTVATAPAPVTVDRVQVTEERQGVETRRQVAPGGRSVEVVPVKPGTSAPPVSAPGHSTAEALDAASHPGVKVTETPRKTATVVTPKPKSGRYVVQVGAFSIEANAKELQERLKKIGQEAWIDHTSLYHVRIGPFETREQAIKARERLESAGISAIIVAGK